MLGQNYFASFCTSVMLIKGNLVVVDFLLCLGILPLFRDMCHKQPQLANKAKPNRPSC